MTSHTRDRPMNWLKWLFLFLTLLLVLCLLITCARGLLCKDHCSVNNSDSGIKILLNKALDEDNGQFTSSPHSTIYVQTTEGKLAAPNKAIGLDARCFSETDYLDDILTLPPTIPPRERDSAAGVVSQGQYRDNFDFSGQGNTDGNLWALNLTWDNTTITLINFNKDGRLESRILTKNQLNKSQVVNAELDGYLSNGAPGTPLNEYKQVQKTLQKLSFDNSLWGRAPAGGEDTEGFLVRDLSGIHASKTPFYRKFNITPGSASPGNINPRQGHVFFYVLMDDFVRFQREFAAMIPYSPQAANDMGHLYTPYVQYPIVPSQDDLTLDSKLVDVMTVHFYQGGTMTKGMGEGAACSYPYDIGVILDGQDGYDQNTPILIDPETETKGPIDL